MIRTPAGDTLRVVLGRLTVNRFSGAITGAFVTGVLNSSSVTTVLVVGFHLVLNRVLPPLLQTEAARRNRDVPVLLAVVTAVGAAWVSYRLGFSPVLGAFIAGLLLGESRFATQIRADVAPLQVLFVTGTDFGTQRGPFISPDAYRDLYKPVQEGNGDPKAYERRTVDWWPRKGVDIICDEARRVYSEA